MSELLIPEQRETASRYDQNLKWFLENYQTIKKEYTEKFVAIYYTHVEDSDADLNNLLEKSRSNQIIFLA